MSLTVLVPAHNEGANIGETLNSLSDQTHRPDTIVVIADNCTDGTVDVARNVGATIYETVGNADKKAGALNQWLDSHLKKLADNDLVMVMDADSVLNPDFLENALTYIARGYHAVGGVFLGKPDPPDSSLSQRFVSMLQRNEYARYARDISRKNGRTLVLTGTATVFTACCLKDVVRGRVDGRLPQSGSTPAVYDTKALTEDNELTYALLHLGYEIIAPPECGLQTEVMPSWRELWKQRYRWKRGAVENNRHYGFTRHTAKYWLLQWWGILGINATVLYILTLALAVASDSLRFHWVWMLVTLVYIAERMVSVASRGCRQIIVAWALMVEMFYDLSLQIVQVRALLGATFGTRKDW